MSAICGECGHDVALHGRRGHGSCRHGRGGGLLAAVRVVEACVVAGVGDAERKQLVDAALCATPCQCKRFARRPARDR